MQIQPINNYNQTSFRGHGARHIGYVMNKLYDSAYRKGLYVGGGADLPDILSVTTTLKNGLEVTGIASFERGKFAYLSLPYEHAQYRSEFCANIIRKFNESVTKGKANR